MRRISNASPGQHSRGDGKNGEDGEKYVNL